MSVLELRNREFFCYNSTSGTQDKMACYLGSTHSGSNIDVLNMSVESRINVKLHLKVHDVSMYIFFIKLDRFIDLGDMFDFP